MSCAPLAKADSEYLVSRLVPNVSQKDIQLKINAFVNSYFNSGKAVTQSDLLGQFAGNGSVPFEMGLIDPQSYLKFTFLIKYKDNQYKLKIIAKGTTSAKYGDGLIFGHHKELLQKKYKEFDDALLEYINNGSSDFDF